MRVPSYSHHRATGQAYVKLNGKFVYLGTYGTEESRRKGEQVIGSTCPTAGRSLQQSLRNPVSRSARCTQVIWSIAANTISETASQRANTRLTSVCGRKSDTGSVGHRLLGLTEQLIEIPFKVDAA